MSGGGKAAPGPGGRARRVLVVLLAAVAGAAVVVLVVPHLRGRTPATAAASNSAAGSAGTGASPSVPPVPGCSGGSDPVQAVQTVLNSAPGGVEGAAQVAATVTRFTEGKAFGGPAAADTVRKIADGSGAPDLVAFQQGQAPYVGQMVDSHASPGRGAWALAAADASTPVVTVLVPVAWSTQAATHNDWRFIDVRLVREGDRWTVRSAASTPRVPPELLALQTGGVHAGDLDRYGAALDAQGFRRYADGDC